MLGNQIDQAFLKDDARLVDLMEMIAACDPESKAGFLARVDALKRSYAEMSDIYQASKADSEIPLG